MTNGERGYAMAALLVAMSVMAVVLSVAMPVWRTAAQREREAELIFRGEQYAHAIQLYSRRNGGYPPSLEVLEKGRFIRKLYKDPVSDEADFQPVLFGQLIAGQPATPRQPAIANQRGGPGQTGQPLPTGPGAGRARQPPAQPLGQSLGQRGAIGGGPVIGVVSGSTAESMRAYNGRGRYNEWAFVSTAMSQQAGAPTGTQDSTTPGLGRGGQPGPPNGVGRGLTPQGETPPILGRFGAGGPRAAPQPR